MFFVKFHPQPRDLSFTTLSVVQFFFVFGPELIFFDKTSLRSSIYRKKTLFNFKQTLFKIKQTLFNIRQGLYKTKRFPRFRVSEPIFIQTPHNFYTDPPFPYGHMWILTVASRGGARWIGHVKLRWEGADGMAIRARGAELHIVRRGGPNGNFWK